MKHGQFFIRLVGSLVLVLSVNLAFAQTDFWQQTNGPLGGTVNEVVVNKANGYVFAAIAGAGMARSADNGESWTPINSGLTNLTVQALALNANGNVFAGTNQGIFRSLDNGASWTQVNTSITTRNIQSLAINLGTGDIFAGASFVTIYHSSDNGSNWTKLNTGLTDTDNIQALAINQATGVVFAGTDKNGILRSGDNGNTWVKADTGLTYKNVRALILTAAGEILAGADSVITKRGIFRSVNNGSRWTQVMTAPNSVISFAVNSGGRIFAGTQGSGVYLSTDNGNNWSPQNTGFRSLAILALALNVNDHAFAGTHCSGIFRSTNNAASWTPVNAGLKYTEIISLAVDQTSGYVFAGTDCGGIFRSTDSGDDWTWVGLPNQTIAALISHPNGTLFAGTQGVDIFAGAGGDIYRSTNEGDTWEEISPDNDYFLSFAVAPNGDIYAGIGYFQLCGFTFCDYGDIFQSTNNGQSWARVALKLDDHVHALAVNASGRVFAGTPEGIYRRFGEFWHKVSAVNTRSLLFHPPTGHIFAGTSGGILRSIDDGESWNLVNSLPDNYTWALAAAANGNIYATTEKSGILHSADNGITWEQASTGLTINDARSLALHHSSGRSFAGTNGRGVFRYEQPTAVNEIASEMPLSFELVQNYPNPFNPSTTIKYDVAQPVEVKLLIHDMLGQHVRTLVDQTQQAGRYAVVWDGRNEQGQPVASGVFIYQIQAGSFVQSRRMALVR